VLRYVVALARLSALDYARAQGEDKLHLPHAANEHDVSLIRERRDRYFEKWAIKKQQLADILAPYRSQ
jgi:hypothetical protein